MEIKNTKKNENSFQQVYSSPEINVMDINAGKVFCSSPAAVDTESFGMENLFLW